MKTVVYLMRHAQSIPQEGMENREWPLSEEGQNQSHLAVPKLESLNIDVIYSSPFPRAVDAIKPFAHKKGLEINTHEGFRDIGVINRTVAPVEYQDLIKQMFEDADFVHPEGEESFKNCQERFLKAMNDIARIHEGKKILICTHGMSIGTVLQLADSSYNYDDWSRMKMPHIFKFVSDGKNGMWDKDFKLDFSPKK